MKCTKTVTIRIDEEVYNKFRYICKEEYRSISSKVSRCIKQVVREFEEENGEIMLEKE